MSWQHRRGTLGGSACAPTIALLLLVGTLPACSSDPDPSAAPTLSPPIATYGPEEFVSSAQIRTLRAPDGTLHAMLRYSDVAEATAFNIVSAEYGDHFWSNDDGATWNTQAIYTTTFLSVQDERPLETDGHIFSAGGRIFAVSGLENHELVDGVWQDASVGFAGAVGAERGLVEVETDSSGTAHLLHAHKPGHSPIVTRFDGTTVTTITVEDQMVTNTRPETRAEIAAAEDGATDVVWVGQDDFNAEDPAWEQVVHHVTVSPEGTLSGQHQLPLVRAWWQAGGLQHPRVTDFDLFWADGTLHLFVTADEVAPGEITALSEVLGHGVLYASFDGTSWTTPSLVAHAEAPLTVHPTLGVQGGDAVYIVESLDSLEGSGVWRTARLSGGQLGPWRTDAKTQALDGEVELYPRQLLHRGGDAMSTLVVKDRQVRASQYDRVLEGDSDLGIARVRATSPTAIAVSFDRPLDPATADLSAIDVQGLDVTERVLDATSGTVVLRTALQTSGASYQVVVSGLTSASGASGSASADVSGYAAPERFRFANVQSPFTDAPEVLIDSQGRVLTGNVDGNGMSFLRADWTTLDHLPSPPTLASPNAFHLFRERDGDIWFTSGETLFQWDGSNWTEHDAEHQADPTARVRDLQVAGGQLYALFHYGATSAIVKWDGASWSKLPDAPGTMHAIYVGDDGHVVAAAGSLGSFGLYQDAIYRFDGSTWTSEDFTVEPNQFVVGSIHEATSGDVFLAGHGASVNGSTIVLTAVKTAGTVTALEPGGGVAESMPELIVTPNGDVAVVDGGVRRWTGSAWELVPNSDGAQSADYDAYGHLWITTKAMGGMAGNRGLELIAAP